MELKWNNLGQIQIMSSMHQNQGLLERQEVLELIVSRYFKPLFWLQNPVFKENLMGDGVVVEERSGEGYAQHEKEIRAK